MRLWFDRSVVVGIVLLALLMVVNAAVTYWNTRQLREDSQWAAHSRDVLDVLSQLEADVREMQVAQRGFFLTELEDRLKPYEAAKRRLPNRFQRLRNLTEDAPRRQGQAAALEELLRQGTATLEEYIETFRREGMEGLRAITARNGGKSVLDPYLEAAGAFETEERRLLSERAERTGRAYLDAVRFGGVSALFGLVAVGLFVWVLNNSFAAREAAAADLNEQRQLLQATLASIGDGVVATDREGRVTFLNAVASKLTGWEQAEAAGQPLERVFDIVNETTRRSVDNPALRALREGVVVGLANHTILIARDGVERPIDDSAAPIRTVDGRVDGAVLVFRDISEKKEAEQALRLQERRAAGILESITDGFCAVGRDWRFTYVNAQAEKLISRTSEELLGKLIWDEFPGLAGSEFEQAFHRAASDLAPSDVTAYYPDHDRWYEAQVFPAPTGITVYFRDVTEKRKAEEALREGERRLRTAHDLLEGITEGTQELIASLDPEFRYTALNTAYQREFQRLFGPKPEVGDSMVELLQNLPDEQKNAVDLWRRALRGENVTVAMEFGDPGRDRRTFDLRFYPLRDAAGRIVGAGEIARDVTDRVQGEKELRKQTDWLRLLWEAASVLLTTDQPEAMLRGLFAKIAPHFKLDAYFNFMLDDSGDALHLESYTGIPAEAAEGIRHLEFGQAVCGAVALERRPINAEFIQQSDDPRTQLVKRFGIRTYACSPLMAGDRLLGTLSFASRARDRFDDDEIEFLRTVTHYVTVAYERMRLVGELRAGDRRKDEFLALLAHELRNPLAPLRNGLQVVRMSTEPSLRERAQDIMDRQLGHMVRLIDDLLDVSRISRNKLELRKAPTPLSEVVGNAVETARPVIDAAGHDLVLTLPEAPIHLDADLTRLAQVFANLLTNSAKYTKPGGRIELAAFRDGDDVVVEVRDDGIGIPAEALPTIFDMFSQVDRSMERSTRGLGLGLALVKGLTEMHGGSVQAASPGEGKGSVFTVRLPALAAAPPQVPLPRDDDDLRRSGPGRRILVVDDNRDSAESMAQMLSLLGNEVALAHDGLEAVERAEAFLPQVVLMDVGMPRLNGLDATRRIREQPWGVGMKVIALTGWGQEGDRLLSKDAGCDGHLVKPVELSDLQRMLREVAGGPAEGSAIPRR